MRLAGSLDRGQILRGAERAGRRARQGAGNTGREGGKGLREGVDGHSKNRNALLCFRPEAAVGGVSTNWAP